MIKEKRTVDYIREIRSVWVINPRTRVQENDMKNKKKIRQLSKRQLRSSDDVE